MISKRHIVSQILHNCPLVPKNEASAFAPANIALVKYWGKRDSELNLPVTGSLSLSLPLGTHTKVTLCDRDVVSLNGKELTADDPFSRRLFSFCDLFRVTDTFFRIETQNEIPTAAGFASSSSGFAALVLALNDLYGWQKDPQSLSILARLGSGSACRSLYTGFVEWHAGTQEDGMDSFSQPLDSLWPELQVGLCVISEEKKPIDSRKAMQITHDTSPLYKAWPEKVFHDLSLMRKAIRAHDFHLLGQVAESNALAMHATMMAATPPILYWHEGSVSCMHKIWQLRKDGLPLYFTMDAGPNLKLLFLKQDARVIQHHWGPCLH